jgi:kumamolisin
MTDSADPNERLEVSLILRPRHPLAELEARLGQPMSPEEFAATYGANPEDIMQVEEFARSHGLEVVEASQPRRTVRLAGKASDLATIFGVSLQRQRLDDGSFARVASGAPVLPKELSDAVEGVFGLDTRPIAVRRG